MTLLPLVLIKAMFELGTLHSFFNTITMIWHIQPYRQAAKAMIFCGKEKKSGNNNATGPQSGTANEIQS